MRSNHLDDSLPFCERPMVNAFASEADCSCLGDEHAALSTYATMADHS